MTDTKELLRKIAALRMRLDSEESATSTNDPVCAVAEKVQRGNVHNALIESTLHEAQAGKSASGPAPRFTARGARLLRQGRDALQTLRTIADDPQYQEAGPNGAVAAWHHQAAALIEIILRTAQAFPPEVGVQLRLCEGLEQLLMEVDRRTTFLNDGLAARKRASAGIDELAGYLRQLAMGQAISLTPMQAIADGIIAQAKAAQPLRFLYAAPADPARFAAAHGLTVAQVMARVLRDDAEWEASLQLAIIAALVHDVGMVRVPPAVLMTGGPLSNDQRRLIEKHTTVAESMLLKLWPGAAGRSRRPAITTNATTARATRRAAVISRFPTTRSYWPCAMSTPPCARRAHTAPLSTRAPPSPKRCCSPNVTISTRNGPNACCFCRSIRSARSSSFTTA